MAKYLGTKEKVKKGLLSIAEALVIIPANTRTYNWLKNREKVGLKFSAVDADKEVSPRRKRKRRKRSKSARAWDDPVQAKMDQARGREI